MKIFATAGAVLMFGAVSAYAQAPSRLYAGATGSAIHISADEVDPGGTAAVGAVVGVRLTPTFSVEFETRGGLGQASRVYSGPFMSFAGPGATREEIDRLAVNMESRTTWSPGFEWSATAMWRTAGANRIGAALFGGIESTRYDERTTLTVLSIPQGVNQTEADLHRIMPDSHVTRVRGGLTGGLLIPIRLSQRMSVAPEIRYTYGSFGDEIYSTIRAGARLMWGF